MRYLVRVGELKLKIDYYKKLLGIIRENINHLNEQKVLIVWEGNAHNVFIEYYDQYIRELNEIVLNIVLLINFLSAYCDNYGYEYLRLRSKYNSIFDWRNENGNN